MLEERIAGGSNIAYYESMSLQYLRTFQRWCTICSYHGSWQAIRGTLTSQPPFFVGALVTVEWLGLFTF